MSGKKETPRQKMIGMMYLVLTAMLAYAADLLADAVCASGYIEFGNYNSDLARFAEWVTAFAKDVLCTQRRRRGSVGS